MKDNQTGSILLVFLITLPFLILVALYNMSLSLTSLQVARTDQLHTEAQLAADAGADYAVQQINNDGTWTGTTSETVLHNDGKIKTTYSVSVAGDNTAKTLTVTGKTYWPATVTNPNQRVTIKVDLKPITSGIYGVISGEGGLYMSNKSKIVGGDVFVNGNVSLQNNAQIGLSTKPLTLKVADQICPSPPDSTYPRVCASGEGAQPISISGSATIYGTVTATNQTSGAGMSSPGLVAGTVAPEPLPTYDRSAQKAAVSTTKTPTQASCASNNGSVSWPANLKITGDVTLDNGCTVTVNGNVWITGSLTLSQSSKLVVANDLGTTRPVIMVDGSAGANFSNNVAITANSSNTGVELITYWSAAGCSPDCSSVTGTNLANSRTVTTIAINNNGDAPNSIFYAYWSQVSLSNSTQIGALIGQTVNLSNNGTLTFGSPINTGDVTWVVKGYRRQF